MKKTLLLQFLFIGLLFPQEIDINNIDPSDIDPALLQNLTPQQLSILRNNMSQDFPSNSTDELQNKADTSSEEEDDEVEINASLNNFGYNFLRQANNRNFSELPIPDNYKVGLNDNFLVVLSGTLNKSFNTAVQSDGNIVFPELGLIPVFGDTLSEVKKKITALVNESYVGVDVFLTLTSINPKKISIVGAVNIPGVYLVSPFTTISSALSYSDGVNDKASLREILLIKPDGETLNFDLYDLLIFGSRTEDVIVEAGDTILVKAGTKFINVNGEVNRPGIYEFLPGESMQDIINFSLGTTGLANTNKISVDYFDSEDYAIKSKEVQSFDFELDNVLSVNVFPIGFDQAVDLLVLGPLQNSGYYSFNDYSNLEKLVSKLRFTDKIYPFLAVIEQFDAKNLKRSFKFFNLNDKKTYADIKLLPNSKIMFFSIDDFDKYGNYSFNDITSNALKASTLEFIYDGRRYLFPIEGEFSIKELIDFIGINPDDVDQNRIIVESLDSFITPKKLNSKITAVQNQSITTYKKSKMLVSGPNKLRGEFNLDGEISLKDFISQTELDLIDINPFVGVVEKVSDSQRETLLFSPSDEETQDIILDNNSKVFFMGRVFNYGEIGLNQISISKLRDYELRISYRNEALDLPVYGSFNVQDIVNFYGLDMYDIQEDQTTYVKPLQDFSIVGNYKNMVLEADKFHALSFRKINSDLISINVSGEVELPGVYTITTSTSLEDIYELMGGFKEIASQRNIVILRSSTRDAQLKAISRAKSTLREFVATNLQESGNSVDPTLLNLIETDIPEESLGRVGGDFTLESKIIGKFLLEDGDQIYVPRKLSTVSIFGEVLNPNTVVYEKGYSINDYIEMSGGLKQFALKRDIYIIKGNGTIERRKRNIFLGGNTIEPGDVIIVPRNMKIAEPYSEIILSTTSTLYNLAFAASALNAIQDN